MSYLPDEPQDWIELERNFLAGDLVVGIGYGIQLVLYVSCTRYLWRQRRQTNVFKFLLAYITLLLAIETIFVAVQGNTVQMIYVDNRAYPGGPWQYFLDTQYLAANVMFYATLFVLTFLSDILVLWRCWVIWTASGRAVAFLVIVFPSVALLASFVMGTLWTLQSSYPGWSMYSHLPWAFGTSYYAISLGINILLTILITLRLLMYRKRVLRTLPKQHAQHYVSLATIIIESAALYSICAIPFLITYGIQHPTNQVFFGVASAGQQISGYLIIYRLAEGRAWSKDTLKTKTIHNTNGASSATTKRDETLTNFTSGFQATYDMSDTSFHLTNASSELPHQSQISEIEKAV